MSETPSVVSTEDDDGKRKRWLVERRDLSEHPLFWSGQGAWLSDAEKVPKAYRYQTMYEAQLAVMNETEQGRPFGFGVWLTEHYLEQSP